MKNHLHSVLQKFTVATVGGIGTFVVGLENINKRSFPPSPVDVVDNVGRVGDERSVVCVELARLVSSTVVVRVTDW